MANITDVVLDVVTDRMLNVTDGFNFWINTLLGVPGSEYPLLPVFQWVNSDNVPAGVGNFPNLVVGDFDEIVIDTATLATKYPFCVIGINGGSASRERMTPTVYSGPVVCTVDLYSSFNKKEMLSDMARQWSGFFVDAMIESFNRRDVLHYFANASVIYNNSMEWARARYMPGATQFRQKNRFSFLFHMPTVDGR